MNQSDRQPETEPADRELVARFLARRTQASFLPLYRRHAGRLYRFCGRCLAGSASSPEDAVQETWLRAVRSLPAFEWRCALSTWLIGIALRACLEATRESARVLSFEPGQEPDEPPAFDRDSAAMLDLQRMLASLAPGYRAVLVLHDLEGFTHEEIAAALAIAPGTAKSQLSRARRAAREWLGAHDGRHTQEMPS